MSGTSAVWQRRVRVLVVDDEPVIREAMAELLRDDGYLVDEASNGAVALELALSNRPDVILFDWVMPVWDGPTMVNAVREVIRPPPILVGVSALHESRSWCEALGIPIFVMKPFEQSTLVHAIDSAVALAEARTRSREQPSATPRKRNACVVAVGDLRSEGALHDLLPATLRDARIVMVEDPEEAERVLGMIVPDLLIVADSVEHDRLRAVATHKGVPVLVRPAAPHESETRMRITDEFPIAAKKH